jgi:phosphoserine aminotransferase
MLADNGIVVGSGYGKFKDSQIRIANFPMHRTEDVKKIIEVLSTIKS